MKKIITVLIDGFGYREEEISNAIKEANMENFKKYYEKYPHSILEASGEYIGLPQNEAGNSKICNEIIGAGTKIKHDITIINEDLTDKSLDNSEEINKIIEHTKTNASQLHILGLINNEKKECDIEYTKKLILKFKEKNIKNIIFHMITGIDENNTSNSINYINDINNFLKSNDIGYVGTICGKFYAMDNNNNWERTKTYLDLLVNGKGLKILNPDVAINNCYKRGLTDDYLPPLIINNEFKFEEHDAVLILNYNKENLIQTSLALTDKSFDKFPISHVNNLRVTTLQKIEETDINTLLETEKQEIYSLGTYFSELDITQARIAYKNKMHDITSSFNGNNIIKLKSCDNYEIEIDKLTNFEEYPETGLVDILKQTKKCMEKDYDFILVDIPNIDLIAHTGNYKKTKEAIKIIDLLLEKIHEYALDNFYTLILTSNYGNAEMMLEGINTHTTNPVPFIIFDETIKLKEKGDISMIAPTILDYVDITKPSTMQDTKSLIIKETNYE